MLEVIGLGRSYGATRALDDVSVSVGQGEVLCVLGPSGCGKSTLLRIVAGLERPDTGAVRIGGVEVASPGWIVPPDRRSVNMVFQDYALWPHLRVRQIVGYGLHRLRRAERAAKVAELLSLLHLDGLADRFPAQLSGGQQQRVAIARALATEPDLLLFDEPLSNLDVQLRHEMRTEVADLLARLGRTALYVTHDPLEACAVADRLLILRHGRPEQMGPPAQLFADPASPWVAALAGYSNRLPGALLRPVGGDLWLARVADQELAVRPRGAAGADETAAVLLHPDGLRLAGSSSNRLQGIVRGSWFEGRNWLVRVTLPGGAELAVPATGPEPAGSPVTVRVDPSYALAFATSDPPVTVGNLPAPLAVG